jgi:hypothetical protein
MRDLHKTRIPSHFIHFSAVSIFGKSISQRVDRKVIVNLGNQSVETQSINMPQPSTISQDAALLESIDTSSAMNLHKSNLMRMQVGELLEECQFDLQSRKWASDANEYLQMVSRVISKIMFKEGSYQDRADRPASVEIHKENNLSVEPIGFTKTPFAWTKKSGNAQVLPTFTLLVTLPADAISAKDYLNNRYIDVSTTELENFVLNGVALNIVYINTLETHLHHAKCSQAVGGESQESR